MPIYEFYCPKCNMMFNFLSKAVNTTGQPDCPKCKRKRLTRQISMFASVGRAKEDAGDGKGADDFPVDDAKMERAMDALAREADGLSEDDPRQAANLMRKFSSMTGMELGPGMQEALTRLEAGESPDAIESELGDRLEKEDPFLMPDKKGRPRAQARPTPKRDATLQEM
jgi:putative FmdB family regulatory protein